MAMSLLLTTIFFLVTSATFYGDVNGVDANVNTTVAETCNAISKFMDFDYCVSRLRSVPGSASADRHTHFLMATDLAAVSAALAWDTAARMACEESDPAVLDALETCGYLHWAAAMPALRMYRGYAAARDYLAAGALSWLVDQAGIGCHAALKGEGGGAAAVIKMVEVNREFTKLSAMADLILDS